MDNTALKHTDIEQEAADNDSDQYLTFILDQEEYGLEILRVQGIQGWDKVTKIPNTPDYVLGVINLRGQIVPIIDLRKRFSLDPMKFSATTVVIILKMLDQDDERTVGIVVDGVCETYKLDVNNIQETPDFGSQIKMDFINGLASVDDKMIIILNIDQLVDFQDIKKASEVDVSE